MSLVSLDAIVQADATLIVGILFLLTLKQVLKQKVTRDDLKFVASAIILYALSAIAAVFPDPVSSLALVLGFALENPVAAAYMDWLVRMSSFVSILLFYLGMAVTAGAVYWMMRRTGISEREKDKVGDRSDVRKQEEQPRRGVEWTAPLSTSVVTPLERERVRATLVLGLIAAILGLRLWEHALPEPFAWVPTASGVLLLYWLIYVGAAAYGVSEDLFGRGFCGWALWFAHQSFKFAMVVTAIMVAWILMPFVKIAWSYEAVAFLTFVTLGFSELRYFLKESRNRIADAKSRLSAWAVLAILVLLLFLLGYVH